MKAPTERSRVYPYYVVATFLVAYVFSYVDRMLLGLVVNPVRSDLALTEVQMSFLLGASFAIFYVLFGFPLGRWADTRSRRNLIVFGVTVWSLATIACGLANDFWTLFAARAFVGIGEAALLPCVYSLIPDYFRRERVGLALAIFACGITLGGGLGLMAAGKVIHLLQTGALSIPLLESLHPWQSAFILVGGPGLLVALLIRTTVIEPPRSSVRSTDVPSSKQVLGFLLSHRATIAPIYLGYAIHGITVYGYATWGPSYFIRLHGLSTEQVGLFVGLVFAILGTAGNLLGGVLCDTLRRRGYLDAPIRVVVLSMLLAVPALVTAYLTSSTVLAMTLFALGLFVANAKLGVAPAAIHALFPSRMHGQASALYVALVSFFGLVAGPTIVASLTEHVFGGDMGTGKSLAVVSALASVVALALILFPWSKTTAHIAMVARLEPAAASREPDPSFRPDQGVARERPA